MASWKKWYNFYADTTSLDRDKLYYFYAAILIVLVFVAIPFYYRNYGVITEDPISSNAKIELYGEYEKIKPLAEIVLIKEEPFFKRGEKWGILYYEFTSTLNGRQVFIHYNRQFVDNGWTFLQIETEYDNNIDTGKRTACYQKDKYSARLHYKEEQAFSGKPTNFSIFLSSD